MLDIHTHILPGIDDGAKTPKEGLALTEQMKSQGITAAIATPHFFPGSMDLNEFLENRKAALARLTAGGKPPVDIILGAEVLYFGGISNFENVRRLTAGGSDYLLLELYGVKAIDDKVIKDIVNLKENLGVTPIIAHVERYCKYKGYRKLIATIEAGHALCQINAGFFNFPAEARAVKKLLRRGLVDFMATDCHSPVTRPVKYLEGMKALEAISPSGAKRVIRKTEKLESEIIAHAKRHS